MPQKNSPSNRSRCSTEPASAARALRPAECWLIKKTPTAAPAAAPSRDMVCSRTRLRLTSGRECGSRSRAVVKFRSIVAALLLAVWLPATLHCAMESAGVLTSHSTACCSDGQTCADDNCGVLETGAYRSGGASAQVAAPDLLACVCLLCPPLVPIATSESPLAPSVVDRPLDWVPVWRFVQRAAPSPRAPSLA